MLKEVADKAVELSSYLEGVELWEEWEEEVVNQTSSPRSMKEERRMWRALDECDKEEAKEVARAAKKALKKVNQARSRMGAGKKQPGIADMLAKQSQITTLQTCRLPEAFVRIGLVLDEVSPKKLKTRENQQPVTAVGIWGPEGNAGIGYVTDEVGHKKLKTGTYQQPSSPVGPTMRDE